jgi:hypothetical protein
MLPNRTNRTNRIASNQIERTRLALQEYSGQRARRRRASLPIAQAYHDLSIRGVVTEQSSAVGVSCGRARCGVDFD